MLQTERFKMPVQQSLPVHDHDDRNLNRILICLVQCLQLAMMAAKYTLTVTVFDLSRLVSLVDLTANVVDACQLCAFAIQVVNVTLICVLTYYTFVKLEFLRCNNVSLLFVWKADGL